MGTDRELVADYAVNVCAVGTVISGKFEVVRVLGQGAMGVVVAARHLELDEIVAIKFIHPEMHSVPDIVSRFAREAKACARLGSEHIAKVLDVGVAPAIGPYIVMEYLEGQDMAAVLRKRGTLPVHRASEYVMQVCEALALAHAAGIIHRDVKPENLFLTRRGNLEIVKVLDFGISKTPLHGRAFGSEVRVAETACLMGTPLYMSPEQIRATHEVDHRSDIWALGVVLFELLTGRTAFAGETLTQVCALVLEGQTPRLADHCRQAPNGLGAVIERCLMKDPAQRYQNAADLAHALLPFAPSRARLHAERASSVLRRDSASLVAETSQRLTPPGPEPGSPAAATISAPVASTGNGGIAGLFTGAGIKGLFARVGGRRLAWIAGVAVMGLGVWAMAAAAARPVDAPPISVTQRTLPYPARSVAPMPPVPLEIAPPPSAPSNLGAAPAREPRSRSVTPARVRDPRRAAAAKLAQLHRAVDQVSPAAPAADATEPGPVESPKETAVPARVRLLDVPARARLVE